MSAVIPLPQSFVLDLQAKQCIAKDKKGGRIAKKEKMSYWKHLQPEGASFFTKDSTHMCAVNKSRDCLSI